MEHLIVQKFTVALLNQMFVSTFQEIVQIFCFKSETITSCCLNMNVIISFFAFIAPRIMKDCWLKGTKFKHCNIIRPMLLIRLIVLLP